MRPHHAPIRDAAARLAPRVDSPRREAEILLAHALGLTDRTDLYTREIALTPDVLRRVEAEAQ